MTKKFNISTRILTLIVTLAILIASLPLTVFALERNENDAGEESTVNTGEKIQLDTYELIAQRDEYTKYFKKPDGSVYVAQYDLPVHYLDNNDEWQDIDNTLRSSGSEYSTNSARIKFAKKINGNNGLFTLHDGNHKLTLSLNGAIKKTTGKVVELYDDCEYDTELQKMTALSKLSANIVYENILNNTDVEYVIRSYNVKENIIVKERSDAYVYTFTIKLNNLEAELDENGDVNIYDPDSGELIYCIPAPVVYDANNAYAPDEAAYFVLAESGNNTYSLSVIADSEWMNAEERAYPVTVDPTFYYGGRNLGQMRDTFVSSANPNTKYGSNTSLKVGYDTTYGYMRSYVAIKNLPSLPANAYITSATLNLGVLSNFILPTDMYLTASTIDFNMASIWSESTVCWNTHPNAFSDTLDYIHLSSGQILGSYLIWDVTKAVREWYAGTTTNLGIAVCMNEETTTTTQYVTFASSESNYGNTYMPFYSFTYIDTKGVEGYNSYLTTDAGLAGTSYVNYATGALTLSKSLLGTTDSLFSYAPSLVYNSSLAGLDYKYPNVQISYWGASVPRGFKLSIQETLIQKQYLSSDNSLQDYYIWADGDGTEHAFYSVDNSTTDYADEDGLQLKLHVTSTECTITDDSKTVRSFTKLSRTPDSSVLSGWYLKKITDVNGNQLIFTFDSGPRPIGVSVKPNESSEISFLEIKYESNQMPYMIWNPTTKEAMIFRYSSTATGGISTSSPKYLKQIQYAHGTSSVTSSNWLAFYNNASSTTNITVDATVNYTYDSAGRLITAQDAMSEYEIRYTYTGDKVTEIKEYAAETTAGQQVTLSYYSGYTEVRSSGSDDAYGNSDDLITTYTFDLRGRVKSYYTTDVSKTIVYGAKSGVYEDDDIAKNKIKTTSAIGGSAANYLLDGGFENSSLSAWSYHGSYVGVQDSSIDPVGNREVYICSDPGETKSISQKVHLPAGTYTLSMRIGTVNCEDVSVYLKAESLDINSNVFIEEVPVNNVYASGWDTFTGMPITAGNYTSGGGERFEISVVVVGGASLSSNATVYLDDIMLEENIGSSDYNMVQFGHFDNTLLNSSNGVLNGMASVWNTTSSVFSRVEDQEIFGKSAKLTADIDSDNYISQTVYSASSPDDSVKLQGATFILSGFAKGTGQAAGINGKFEIRAFVNYFSGNYESFEFEFEKSYRGWQFVSGSFTTDKNEYISEIVIYCDYSSQPSGYALFDDISLIYDIGERSAQYWYYDVPSSELYGLLAKKKTGCYWEEYTYYSNRKLHTITNSRGEEYVYIYDEDGINIEEDYFYGADGNGTHTLYTYNNYGQVTRKETNDLDGTLDPIVSSYSYRETQGSKIFGALLSETDTLGRTTRYYYDTNNGRLLASANESEGNGVSYTYDAIGNMTSAMPATYVSSTTYTPVTNAEEVDYTYNNRNLLESVTTDSTTYNFVYDSFGNTNEIKVGDTSLAEYEYFTNNGKLKKITYGNGFAVRYVYDELDNISEIWYTDNGIETKVYTYEYTAFGRLFCFNDLISGKSTVYKYDSAGKLTRATEYDSDELTNLLGTAVFYNGNGQTDQLWYTLDYANSGGIDDHQLYYSYSYDNNRLLTGYAFDEFKFESERKGEASFEYDLYDRLTEKTFIVKNKSGTTTKFISKVNYGYSNYTSGSTTYTSGQVSSYASRINNGTTVTYNYTYDGNGNITEIKLGNSSLYRYKYDDLGQLIREDNTVDNRTYVYTYDNAGNILSKKIYSLTSASVTPTNPISTDTYTYGDSTWGDLLTSYKGHSISYDEIGNPDNLYVNGHDYVMTWTAGRRLAAMTNSAGNEYYTFTYNDEGIRTSKTAYGTTHNYLLSGSQIIAEDLGNILLVYLYDENGSPMGMQYRTSSMAANIFYTFWFEKNLQGDIIAVYNESGTKLITYTYDAWGNVTQTIHNHAGSNSYAGYNPFRYRGYYYDTETKLYYLQSRYYSPEMGRFINADGYASTGTGLIGYNMFAYCNNNPVIRKDSNGYFWEKVFDCLNYIIEAVLSSIEAEAGIGLGLGIGCSVGVVTAEAEVYEDVLTARLDDNEIYSTNAGCAQLDVSLLEGNDRLQFGVSGSYQHPYDPCRDHGVFSNPLDMAQCEQTEVSPFGFSFPIAGKLGLDSSEDVILGVGGSKHIIVGYHYSAGFNISEFIRRMCDYEW